MSKAGKKKNFNIESRLITLDFEHEIKRLTEDFTGREWIFHKIDEWLDQKPERFCILTGEPGVGKSAIAARLTQLRDDIVAYHFCIAGRTSTIIPSTTLRSLASQLGNQLPGYGLALANTINPTHLTVQVDINVKNMTGGQITGVVIQHLHASDPETEFDILIRTPLAELPAPTEPIIILVDSLDEAVTHRGEVNLVTLLAKFSDLPPWVHFLCTSRPERRVMRYFDRLEPYFLAIETKLNLDDIRQYIVNRVAKTKIRKRLQVEGVSPMELVERVVILADGNFLYTKVLLDDIEGGQQPLDDLESLPKSLDEIYHGFLSRFSVREWEDRYQPILGVLVVAQEPISEDQVANFTGLRHTKVRQYLGVMIQFLDEKDGDGEVKTYTLFHQSLRDYLQEKERSKDFWCAPEDGHQNIIDFYWDTHNDDWSRSKCDAYGLRNFPTHLYANGRNRQFYALINKQWLDFHLQYLGGYRFFFENINLAIRAATSESPPNMLQMTRLCLIHSQLITPAPPLIISILAQVGQMVRARSMAANIYNALDRCWAYTLLVKALAGSDDMEIMEQYLLEAQQNIKVINDTHKTMALFWIAEAALEAGDANLAHQAGNKGLRIALDYDSEDAWDYPNILFWAAKVLRLVGDEEGLSRIRQIVRNKAMNPMRNQVLQTMSVAGDRNWLEAVAKERLKNENSSIRLANLALALADTNLVDLCEQVLAAIDEGVPDHGGSDTVKRHIWARALLGHFEQALEKVKSIEDLEEKLIALGIIVALAKKSDKESIVHQALTEANSLKSTQDWRVLCRLAWVYFEAGYTAQAIEIANKVCAMNVQLTLENSLTIPHLRRNAFDVSLSGFVAKTGPRPLTTITEPIADEVLMKAVIELASKGSWQEAHERLKDIKVPAFRAQALIGLSHYEKQNQKQLNLWMRALQEARWAGQNEVESILKEGETILNQANLPFTWIELQQVKSRMDGWWVESNQANNHL